ncbi:MAG: PEP-CTERM sorting domain-containing protein [Methyloversatilis sp.]|jgi:hypothetical protein|nr:PEP-CTERM sorting domain-containing protein [Methyloversatilis sp.]
MKKITLIAAAVAALGVSAQANAFTSGSIVFDRDGAGASTAINVTTFDWIPGNALAKDAIGGTPDAQGNVTFTTYFQASLGLFLRPDGPARGVLDDTEFTVQATIVEKGSNLGGAAASFESISGTYKIFYDTTVDANDIAGTGYGDGQLILEGTINAGGTGVFNNSTIAAFLANPAAFPFGPVATSNLDSKETNEKAGIYSHNGNGSSTVTVDVTFANSAFFKSDVTTLLVDLNETTNLAAPFVQANPSSQVVGQTPVYGSGAYIDANGVVQFGSVNGAPCRDGTTTCDFHFQSDSATSFAARVPEPGSLAIAGAGLALMSLIRRRKSK